MSKNSERAIFVRENYFIPASALDNVLKKKIKISIMKFYFMNF